MTAILGRTGNLVGFTTGRGTTPWNTEMEGALRKIDAMLASSVIAITNTLPSSANEGDLYLVGTSPTGVAAGWANRIARWRGSPAGWEAYPPLEGWIVTIVGEATNKVRRYNGTAWVAIAVDSGAEPYAGVPAQTSFWRSTAAGVRAWVQLVAADITDLATTLAGYLPKANPTYTGRLTGPTQYLEADEQVLLAIRRPGGNSGRIHGVSFMAQNDASAWVEFGRAMTYISSVTAGAHTGGMRLIAYKDGAILQALEAGPDGVRVGSGLPLQMGTTTIVDASRNASFAGLTATGNPVFGTSAAGCSVTLNSAAGTVASINLQDAGIVRATMQLYTGSAWRVVARDTSGVEIDSPFYVDLVAGGKLTLGGTARTTNFKGAIEIGAVTIADASRNIAGTTLKATNLVGAEDRPIAADLTGTIQPKTPDQFRNMISALSAALKGAANGVAELGADGRVPTTQLPPYLALGETPATAYRGDRGVIAYNHSQIVTGNPHGTTAADVGALAESALTGTVDANSINSGKSGVYELAATTYTNFWAGITSGQQVTLLQMQSPTGMVTQFATDHQLGGWATRFQVTAIGGAWSPWLFVWDSGSLPVSTFAKTLLDDTTAAAARATLGAAKAPSRVDVSASTTIGSIDDTAVKVTTTDVILTLSGGVDGQGWDIINPTAATGIAIPSGATLWKSIGSDVGPTTIALGGGKPIRITRIDANTWTMLGSQ